MHACMHARMHARTHTHTHTKLNKQILICSLIRLSNYTHRVRAFHTQAHNTSKLDMHTHMHMRILQSTALDDM